MAVLKNNCSFFFIAKKNESFKTSGIHIFFPFQSYLEFYLNPMLFASCTNIDLLYIFDRSEISLRIFQTMLKINNIVTTEYMDVYEIFI